jgi:hypothetical protein
MLDTFAAAVVAELGVHIIIKFPFFVLPCHRRRALPGKQYGDKASATTTPDRVLLASTVAVAARVLWRGVDAVGFPGGLWVGAPFIQPYLHRFRRPVPAERDAPRPTWALKELSQAIRDTPWRRWPQWLTLTVLAVFSPALLFCKWAHRRLFRQRWVALEPRRRA